MDINETPYGASAPPNKPKNKKDEDKNPSSTLVVGGAEDEDVDDDDKDDDYTDLDSTSSREDEEKPFFKKPIFIGAIAIVAVAVIGLATYSMFKPEPEPPPAPDEAMEEVDPSVQMKDDLYQIGIGKQSLNEKRIYEQGNIESDDFRKDFTNSGGAEQYALPIDIVTVTDSVAYIKHRTVTGDGMEVYWVDATYKSKKTVFTIPYYIWQTLSKEGVMDVVVEVITDANENVYIGSITALPPTEGN